MSEAAIQPFGVTQRSERFRAEQLGDLLRHCRGRLTVPAARKQTTQRKARLTQEDVAQLLGVGERHYRDFESGRVKRPDSAFLDRVATVLRMSVAEREVLYHLAAGHAPVRQATRADVTAMQEWIDSVPGQPALVTDLAWNLLVWNQDEPLMLQDPAMLPVEQRNAILWMFGQTAKERFPDIEQEYPMLVGRVRTAYLCAHGSDPALNDLVERLLAIPEAARWWRAGVLHAEPVIQTRRMRGPDGLIRHVRSISTTIPQQGLRLIVFIPADEPMSTAPET